MKHRIPVFVFLVGCATAELQAHGADYGVIVERQSQTPAIFSHSIEEGLPSNLALTECVAAAKTAMLSAHIGIDPTIERGTQTVSTSLYGTHLGRNRVVIGCFPRNGLVYIEAVGPTPESLTTLVDQLNGDISERLIQKQSK